MVYRLRGALDENAVKHAIALSEEKYCSIEAMLKKTAKVTLRYEYFLRCESPPRLFLAKRIAYNQHLRSSRKNQQGASCLAASPQKLRV